MMDPKDEFSVINSWLGDARAVIALNKTLRWDVVKWTITLNLALAAAAGSFRAWSFWFVLISIIMATFGLFVMWHYNKRLTSARRKLENLSTYVRDHFLDVWQIMDAKLETKGQGYDRQELVLFYAALAVSVLPCMIVWLSGKNILGLPGLCT